jgi:hypothetical protein
MDIEKKYNFTEEELHTKSSLVVFSVMMKLIDVMFSGAPETEEEKKEVFYKISQSVFKILTTD